MSSRGPSGAWERVRLRRGCVPEMSPLVHCGPSSGKQRKRGSDHWACAVARSQACGGPGPPGAHGHRSECSACPTAWMTWEGGWAAWGRRQGH